VRSEGDEAARSHPPQEGERGTLAERRARRAWLGDAALLRRAEAAEATVRTLEAHLADLRYRQVEAERERERTAAQLAERERELRRVKQREYAEQQLRMEAEEAVARVRRGHRGELERLQQRAAQAHASAQHAEEQRAVLAARLIEVDGGCARLQRSVDALQRAAAELRVAFVRDHEAARTRIGELEHALERARGPVRAEVDEAVRREQMTGALAAAVERLRARVDTVGEQASAAPAASMSAAGAAPTSPVGAAPASAAGTTAPTSQAPPPAPEPPVVERPVVEPSVVEPSVQRPPVAPAATGEGDRPTATPAEPASHAPTPPAPAPEISTVYVVPRLFPASASRERGRVGRRLAPAARRVARRLAAWADRTQGPR
jgi:hypothetical protein